MAVADGLPGPGQGLVRRPPGRGGALSVTWCNGTVLALLVGDLAVVEAEHLRRRIGDVMDGGRARVVVDASAASWLSDEVVAVLDEIGREVEADGGDLVVVDPPPALERRLRRCGISARVSRIHAEER